jgi:iron-sulfur cluster assembly protein
MSVALSQEAIDAVKHMLLARGSSDETSLRVGIRGGGCSGFSYVFEWHDGPPRTVDVMFDFAASDGSNVRVLVDKKSLVYLTGATVDHERSLARSGFLVDNPNAVASCGCGESFELKPDRLPRPR